jgi:class 3 adenylate cyclase/tetratricopeptide (TPR) repeat protein
MATAPLSSRYARSTRTRHEADRTSGVGAENDIDFDVLAKLTDADLKELGVGSLGHRKRLLAAIAELKSQPERRLQSLSTSAGGERRRVTILFADLCGFTALSRSLDPEEIRDVVSRFTTLVDSIVVNYGGSIDKHIGDAVMALFGAPRAHDDDPLRAARAALDIHSALPRIADETRPPLKAHIGVASGEVVAGKLGRGDAHDYTILGDSVNLAARLVAMADPGETLLSDRVHRALGGHGVCEPLGEANVKGFEAPIPVWRLQGLSSEPGPSNRSSFVGRTAELEQFKEIVAATIARRSGHVIYVRGEAGIGKTRLVEEMRRIADASGFSTHRGHVLDFGVVKEQSALRALLFGLVGLPPGSDPEAREQKVVDLVETGVVRSEQVAFLRDLLDLPQTEEWRTLYDAMDNAARNRGAREAASALAKRALAQSPTFIIIEDLHWADPQLLGHVGALATAMNDGPGLLAMTSRVDGDPIDAQWRASCRDTPFATIDLGPLRTDEAISLAGGFVDATQRIAMACIERAGGNPLFLEQLLRNAEEGTADAIPPSIQSLVLARMDRLSIADHQAFQAAAVIGQRFNLPLLRHLLDDPHYSCDGLLSNALIQLEAEDFLFEGSYASLLRSTRKDLHRRAAEWFAGQDLGLHAQHLDRAEDERAAAAYLEVALGQRAEHRLESALRLVDRGLQIARADAERFSMICLRGELQRDLGDIVGSIASFRLAVAAATDEPRLCQAQLGLAEGLRVSEGLDEALRLLDHAQRTAENHAMVNELARLHHLRGNIFFPMGNIESCKREHEQGLIYATQTGSPEARARALSGLGDAAYAQGKMRTAFEHFSRCVSLSQEHGLGRNEVANRSMVGFTRMYLNEARKAGEDGDAAARVAAIVGQPRAELLGETMGVIASYELADFVAMRNYLDRKMRLVRQLGARRFEVQTLEFEARMLFDLGHRRDAESKLREALAICREVGTQFRGPVIASALSRVVEDPDQRQALLVEGRSMLGRGAVGHNHLWFYRDAIEAQLAAGDVASALQYVHALEDYTRAEPLPWAEIFAVRGRALCAAIRDGVTDSIRRELERVRDTLGKAGLAAFLPPIQAVLAG